MENSNITLEHPAERIIYVEPNDIFGSVDGVPLTPDYTDLCISFDLIVEVVSRLRANSATISKNGEDGATKKYVISWTSKYGDNEETGPNYVSFMGSENYGGKKDDPSYLTTYYVDSYYNEFKNRTIVEGLGVESLSITFETYYAPTVKIRFVDVRGASIFGREEVLHEDEVLKEDNIWGCFFTFPYPKYKLQVKGFYGRAVTYQLCCTDFRAQFNPQTGNYEIDMSFVGYDFGLLADVPMNLLIAAPQCKYADTVGYWQKQCSTNPDWVMTDGNTPNTFKFIKDNISETLQKFNKEETIEYIDEIIEREIVDQERRNALDSMKQTADELRKYDALSCKNTDSTTKTYTGNLTPLGQQMYQNNTAMTQNEIVIKNMTDIKSGQVSEDGGLVYDIPKATNDLKTETYNLRNELTEKYKDYVGKWETFFTKDGFTGFTDEDYAVGALFETVFVSDFCAFYKALQNEYSKTISTEQYTEQKEVRTMPKIEGENIHDLVKITPNISNVFLTLYCHLETFIHMIYECASRIYAQIGRNERKLEDLGLPSFAYTDVEYSDDEKNRQIPPFPAVYTFESVDDYDTDDEGQTDSIKVDAWIREVAGNSSPWEEEMLVEQLYKAVMKTLPETALKQTVFNPSDYPIIPRDLNGNTSSIAIDCTIDDLAGYLSLRAATIFGICKYTESDAQVIGKADAINFFSGGIHKDKVKREIFERFKSYNKQDLVRDIALCVKGNNGSDRETMSGGGGNKSSFEVYRNILSTNSDKHPLFKRKNGKLRYCYTTATNENALVPITITGWDKIKGTENNTCGVKMEKSGEGILTEFSLMVVSEREKYTSNALYKYKSKNSLSKDEQKKYVNSEIFEIYTNEDVEKIENIYNNMKNKTVSVNGFSGEFDFTKVLENGWSNVGEDEYKAQYYTTLTHLHPSLEASGLMKNGKIKEPEDSISSWYKGNVIDKTVKYETKGDSGGSFIWNTNDFSEESCFVIPIISLHEKTLYQTNVFTSDIYYEQNNKSDKKEEAKALLFLLSIADLNGNEPNFNKRKKNKTFAKIEGVPYSLVLLYGGLLYLKNVDNDCIKYSKKYKVPQQIENKFEVPLFNYNVNNKSKKLGGVICKTDYTIQYLDINDIVNIEDISIENTLINRFLDFVAKQWSIIRNYFEVKSDGGTDITKLSEIEESADIDKKYLYYEFDGKTNNICYSIPDTTGDGMSVLRDFYLEKSIAQKTVASFEENNGVIDIGQNVFENYLNGFFTELEEISESETVNTIENSETEEDEYSTDMKRSIYMYIKNLWDRWFSCNSEETFKVSNYMKNTIFMDSMYRNTAKNIHINCEILSDLLSENDGQSMVFKFLSDITTKHSCMFFALPDYINIGSDNQKDAISAMETVFTPIPYSNIDRIESFNKYIVMFVQPSHINNNTNGYSYDSFDIYSHDTNDISILSTFKKQAMNGTSENDNENSIRVNRYGYNIPSFGVSFGRQHNSIFKNVSVGMQNPVQTEQAINATANLANRGRGSGSRMIFYGQDIYPVYTGYSYTATVEMMGNAQIMPLMYFQLFNIPMFRGAYMIYSVTHTMKPGDMTTTVKAMKMSKHTLPYCKEWYAHYYFDAEGNVYTDSDDECAALTTGKQGSISSEQRQTENEIKNVHPQKRLKDLVGKTRYKSIYDSGAKAYIEEHLVVVQVTVKTITETKKGETFGVTKKYVIVNEELKNDVEAIFDEIYRTTDYCFNTAQFYRYPQHGEKPLQDFNPPANGVSTVIGSYEYRNTSSGTMSNHAYGCAIDINPVYNEQKKYVDDKPDNNKYIRTKNHPVVRIFAKHGWGWGGSYGDFMHFSPFYGS